MASGLPANQLLHAGKLLNDEFQNLRQAHIYDDDPGGGVRAAEWFTNKKRALLSDYGVGTLDQALIPILPVRHNFVRLWATVPSPFLSRAASS